VSLKASGLRVSGTNQKLVFGKLEDAASLARACPRCTRCWAPVSEEDPRKVLEFAKEKREELYEPMTSLAQQYNGVLVTPETAAKADSEE